MSHPFSPGGNPHTATAGASHRVYSTSGAARCASRPRLSTAQRGVLASGLDGRRAGWQFVPRAATEPGSAAPSVEPDHHLSNLPLPRGSWKSYIPIVGETLELALDPVAFVADRSRQYGPVFRSHLFGEQMYVACSNEAFRTVCINQEFKSVSMHFPKSLRKLINNPQDDVATYDSHQASRRRWANAFAPDAMESYMRSINNRLVVWLEQRVADGEFDLLPAVEHLTLGFAAELIVGLDMDEEQEAWLLNEYQTFGDGIVSAFPYEVPFTPFWAAMQARARLLQFFKENVKRVRSRMAEEKGIRGRHNMLYYTVTIDGKDVSDDVLAVKVLQLTVAGHETTRSSFSTLLAMYPHLPPRVLAQLREEQERVVAKHGPCMTAVAAADMRYAEATVNEVLRLMGPSRGMYRVAHQDFELSGLRIPAGSILFVSTDGIHTVDPAVAPDHGNSSNGSSDTDSSACSGGSTDSGSGGGCGADLSHMDALNLEASFRPERWLEPESSGLPRPTLAAFGAGPHVCVGKPLFYLEAKALLAHLARAYDVEPVSGAVQRWDILPFPQPAPSVVLRLSPRQPATGE